MVPRPGSRFRVPFLIALALLAAGPVRAEDPVAEAKRHFRQAEAYFRAGTYDRAIEEYEVAYRLAPRPALLFNLGLCHEKLKDAAKAVELYDRYLSEAPEGLKASEARARREALARGLEQSEAEAARAAEAAELRRRAKERSAAGEHGEALAAIEKARGLSSDPEILFELAEVYRRGGEGVLALAEYRRYLSASQTGRHRTDAARRIDELEAPRTGGTGARGQGGKLPGPGRRIDDGGGRDRPTLIPAIAAYAAAAAFAGAGMLWGSSSSDTLSKIDSEIESGDPPLDSGDPRFDAGKRDARRANLAFALAGVSLAAGAAFTVWALWPRSDDDAGARAALSPYAGPGLAGASLEVTW